MGTATFVRMAVIVFGVVALIHFYRGIVGLPLTVGSFQAPIWVSFAESVFFFGLALWGARSSQLGKKPGG